MSAAKAQELPDGATTDGAYPNGQARLHARPEPDLLVDLREAGHPIQDIAEKLGLSRATTYRWLVRYGIPRRPIAMHRGTAPTHGDRGRWLATPDLLALWAGCEHDVERLAQHTGIRPSALRERLITSGCLPEHHRT
jgi:hypothetical protein